MTKVKSIFLALIMLCCSMFALVACDNIVVPEKSIKPKYGTYVCTSAGYTDKSHLSEWYQMNNLVVIREDSADFFGWINGDYRAVTNIDYTLNNNKATIEIGEETINATFVDDETIVIKMGEGDYGFIETFSYTATTFSTIETGTYVNSDEGMTITISSINNIRIQHSTYGIDFTTSFTILGGRVVQIYNADLEETYLIYVAQNGSNNGNLVCYNMCIKYADEYGNVMKQFYDSITLYRQTA